jgi:hypothetical protein
MLSSWRPAPQLPQAPSIKSPIKPPADAGTGEIRAPTAMAAAALNTLRVFVFIVLLLMIRLRMVGVSLFFVG